MRVLPSLVLSFIALCASAPRIAAAQTPAAQPAAPQQTDTPPLPDIISLMRDVEANQLRSENLKQDYTYHVHTVQQELDSSGNVKKTAMTDAESMTIDGVRVDRVVMRDGKPLTPDQAQKENERIDKQVQHDKATRARNQNKGRTTDAEGDQMLTLSRILALGTFSNLRADTYAGRPVWAVDYNGNPNAKTQNEFEKAFRDLAGTFWVDRDEHVLVAARAHMVNDFKIAGGLLVSLKKGLAFNFTTTRVAPETWLPQLIEAQGTFRFLLFGGGNVHLRVACSDYKKFRTSTTVIPGGRVIGPDGKPLPEPQEQPSATH